MNGRTAASIEFEARPTRQGRTVIVRRTLDLVDGTRTKTVAARVADGEMLNYLQNASARGGTAKLRFSTSVTGAVKLESARVGARSGIQVSPLRPAALRMSVTPTGRGLGVGESGPVIVRLTNVGDRPARDAGVSAITDNRGLKVAKPTRKVLGDFEGQRTVRFRVSAERAGRFKLTLSSGAANTNAPETQLAITVPPGERAAGVGSAKRTAVWVGVTFLIVGLITWRVRRFAAHRA